MLLFLVCILVLDSTLSESLPVSSPDALLGCDRPFRFDWCAIAEAIDSPLLVTSTDSELMVAREEEVSLEGGRAWSLLQGPGESPDIKGDGNGVTSPMAVIMGLGTRELDAEPNPRPKAADLKLGVRETSFKLGTEDLCDSDRAPGLDESRDAKAWYVGC